MIMRAILKHLKMGGKSTLETERIMQLAIEIFNTANNLNLNFSKNIFTNKQYMLEQHST